MTARRTIPVADFVIGPFTLAGLVSPGDAVTLTLNLVGVDPARAEVPTVIAAPDQLVTTGAGMPLKRSVPPVPRLEPTITIGVPGGALSIDRPLVAA